MPVVQQGSINTTALIVPDVYVQIVPPSVSLLNGLPTNILGVVGSAAWGPVNTPAILGDMAGYARQFGDIKARKFDAGTQVAVSVLQGANNFRVVRVTDGTDAAASVVALVNCITFTSKFTGSGANGDTVSISAGSKANTYRAVVARAGYVPEVFDNVAGAGNAFWVNLASAINLGQSGLRGPSELIVATAGVGVTAPAVATYTLTGGTDGAANVTATQLLGVDTTPRTGMYALRGTFTSVALLADCDASTSWANQLAFGFAEGIYMQLVGPAGDTIANAITTKNTAGIDGYDAKMIFGDWIYFNDTVNGQVRLVSPQGYFAGRLANLSPEQSSLNKPMSAIVGTQQSMKGVPYSGAELAALGQAGFDVITNPSPGGNYFSARFGHNCSSNPVTNGDNYTRLTNYIAYTLNAGMGKFVGQLQTPTERLDAAATISTFLDNMWQQGMIGSADGSVPYRVQLDDANNPQGRVALGYQQADVKVRYLSVIEKFLINVEGGQSVVVKPT